MGMSSGCGKGKEGGVHLVWIGKVSQGSGYGRKEGEKGGSHHRQRNKSKGRDGSFPWCLQHYCNTTQLNQQEEGVGSRRLGQASIVRKGAWMLS
jgi:hypothetical protein